MLWLTGLVFLFPVLALVLALVSVSPILLGELLALTFLIWLNCSVVVSFARSLRIGYVASLLFVPFFVTMPELITSTVLAQHGYGLASFMNAVYSVVMDLCFTFALFTLAYYRTCKNILLMQCPRIELPPAYAVIALVPIAVTACMFTDFPNLKICTAPALADLADAVTLLALYTFIIVVPSMYYLVVHRREIAEIVEESERRITFVPAYRQVVLFIISLISLFFLSYQFAERMDIVCTVLGQKIGGVLAAYLTSIPDAMYALAAFSPRIEEVKESLVELWSSSVHDLTRNIAVPVLLYATGLNLMGLTGGPVEADLATLAAMWIATLGWALTHLAEGRGTVVATSRTAGILLTLFALCTAIGVFM